MRKSIDNLDNATLAMPAERCKITHQVGYYKGPHGLPTKDSYREARQKETGGSDIRCFVAGEKVITAMQRKAAAHKS